MNQKSLDTYEQFDRALTRMEGGCTVYANNTRQYGEMTNGMLRDSVIGRFDFTLRLFYKTLRVLLCLEPDVEPKVVLRKAYSLSVINSEEVWLSILKEGTHAHHNHNEDQAIALTNRILALYLPVLLNAREAMKERLNRDSAYTDSDRLELLLRRLPGDVLRNIVGVMDDTGDLAEWRARIDVALLSSTTQ